MRKLISMNRLDGNLGCNVKRLIIILHGLQGLGVWLSAELVLNSLLTVIMLMKMYYMSSYLEISSQKMQQGLIITQLEARRSRFLCLTVIESKLQIISEVSQVLQTQETKTRKLGISLAGGSGLRGSEITQLSAAGSSIVFSNVSLLG